MAVTQAWARWLESKLNQQWFSTSSQKKPDRLPFWFRSGLSLVALFGQPTIFNKTRRQALLHRSTGRPVVVVVGNLVVGGGGKTPIVEALCKTLMKRGFSVGILCSGYASSAYHRPCLVQTNSSAQQVGDEALMLQKNTGGLVAAGKLRTESLRLILQKNPSIDLVISDDGLQHEALSRSLEIVVFDERLAGNEHLLPWGPLREPLARLSSVDWVILPKTIENQPQNPPWIKTITDNHNEHADSQFRAPLFAFSQWNLLGFQTLSEYGQSAITSSSNASLPMAAVHPVSEFAKNIIGHEVNALAGIANPEKFQRTLKALGIDTRLHSPGDHKEVSFDMLTTLSRKTLVMTEKDAVKYLHLSSNAALKNCWVAVGETQIPAALISSIVEKIKASHGPKAT
jgi:tetraacyldisaccharide 4'-kinase